MKEGLKTLLLLFLILSGASNGMEQDTENTLLTNIRLVREENRDTKIDVSNIVEKYIQIGSSIDSAVQTLVLLGFQCRRLDQRAHLSEKYNYIYSAMYDPRPWYSFGFGDVIRIYIYGNNEKIERLYGELSYMHL